MAPPPPASRSGHGFRRAGRILAPKLAAAARHRHYAAARLAAEWAAIAGPACASACRPVKMSKPRAGRPGPGPAGGTLTLEADGARAPEVQMMAPTLIARVNAALGYPAVARIAIVQGWGFAEAQAGFVPAAGPAAAPPAAAVPEPVQATLSSIGDEGLRRALETLAANVLSRRQR